MLQICMHCAKPLGKLVFQFCVPYGLCCLTHLLQELLQSPHTTDHTTCGTRDILIKSQLLFSHACTQCTFKNIRHFADL